MHTRRGRLKGEWTVTAAGPTGADLAAIAGDDIPKIIMDLDAPKAETNREGPKPTDCEAWSERAIECEPHGNSHSVDLSAKGGQAPGRQAKSRHS